MHQDGHGVKLTYQQCRQRNIEFIDVNGDEISEIGCLDSRLNSPPDKESYIEQIIDGRGSVNLQQGHASNQSSLQNLIKRQIQNNR